MNHQYTKFINPNNYEMGFSIYGIIIYLLLMLPNIVWQIFPPINNLLLIDTVSYPILDIFEWIFRILIILFLIFLINKDKTKNKTSYIGVAIAFLAIYYITWLLYYFGIVNPWIIILGMGITPVFYFSFAGLWLRNYLLLIPSLIFGIVHMIISILSYL